MTRFILTGSSGFIGNATYKRLTEQGHELLCIGRSKTEQDGYVQHDLSKPLEGFGFKPEVVIHLAALSSPWGSWEDFQNNNIQATKNVIDFCETHGRPKLIFMSSSSVFYEMKHQLNIREDDTFPPPVNLYVKSKQIAEKAVQSYSGDWVILRPRTVFGPGDTVFFPRILQAASKGIFPDFVTKDGPSIGDFTYIDNLVDTIVHASMGKNIIGHFNLANEQPVEILSFIKETLGQLAIPVRIIKIPANLALKTARVLEWIYSLQGIKGSPPVTRFGITFFAFSKTFNSTKSFAAFGKPKVSIEEGISRFVDWHKSRII